MPTPDPAKIRGGGEEGFSSTNKAESSFSEGSNRNSPPPRLLEGISGPPAPNALSGPLQIGQRTVGSGDRPHELLAPLPLEIPTQDHSLAKKDLRLGKRKGGLPTACLSGRVPSLRRRAGGRAETVERQGLVPCICFSKF